GPNRGLGRRRGAGAGARGGRAGPGRGRGGAAPTRPGPAGGRPGAGSRRTGQRGSRPRRGTSLPGGRLRQRGPRRGRRGECRRVAAALGPTGALPPRALARAVGRAGSRASRTARAARPAGPGWAAGATRTTGADRAAGGVRTGRLDAGPGRPGLPAARSVQGAGRGDAEPGRTVPEHDPRADLTTRLAAATAPAARATPAAPGAWLGLTLTGGTESRIHGVRTPWIRGFMAF